MPTVLIRFTANVRPTSPEGVQKSIRTRRLLDQTTGSYHGLHRTAVPNRRPNSSSPYVSCNHGYDVAGEGKSVASELETETKVSPYLGPTPSQIEPHLVFLLAVLHCSRSPRNIN